MASISASGTGSAAPTRAWGISAALLCLALTGAKAPNSLDIEILDLRSSKGMIRICVTTDAGDFPDCRKSAGAIKRSIAAASPRIRIEGLPHGTYAIAVIHDENENSKLDTFAGIPKEGFGFSRNPRIRFGPPRFTSAQFAVGEGAGHQQVRIRYML